MTAPPLRAEGCVLRGLRDEDLADIVAYASSAGFFDFVPRVPDRLRRRYTVKDAQDFLQACRRAWGGGLPTWAIVPEEGAHRVAGSIRLTRPADPAGDRLEVGFGLHPDARGQGLATAALRAVQAWHADQGGTGLRARCDPRNPGSLRVLLRAGFVPVGEEEGLQVLAWPA